MLTRRAKAYSSFCSQTVSLSPAISSCLLREYRSLMPSCAGFLEPRKSRLGPSKSTFNAENFICSLSMSIAIGFGAVHSWSVRCSWRFQKKTIIFFILGVQGLWKSSMLIGSISRSICNHFHVWMANNAKITTFRGYRSLMPSCTGFLEPKRSRLGSLKSTFNAENFICSLSLSVCSDFGAIRSWNVSRSPKSPKNLQ